jgi:hypothetical protein
MDRADNDLELAAHLPTTACPRFTCSRCPTSRMVASYSDPRGAAGFPGTGPFIPDNAYAECLIGSIRRECLDRVVVIGEAHLRRVLRRYAEYYNRARTHRSLGKDCLVHRRVQTEGAISSSPILGVLHHDHAGM